MGRQALTNFSDKQRADAMKKYRIIEPYLSNQQGIKDISYETKISVRTLYRWIEKYEDDGLIGLIRKIRTDFEQIRFSNEMRQMTEELVLKYKRIST